MKWAGLLLCCTIGLAACTQPSPPEPTRAAPTPTPAAAVVTAVVLQGAGAPPARPVHAPQAAASPSPAALPLSVLAGRSGADVRVALNLLLQEQIYLTAAAVDAATSARLEELIGVSGVLDENSVALAELVGAVRGSDVARTLLDAWRGLVADLIEYAQGRQSAARTDLDQRRPVIATQLAFGGLTRTAIDELLRARIEDQLGTADATVGHNPTLAAERLRLAAAASDVLARRLATAISATLPAAAPPPSEGLDVDVRIGLTRLMQEHTYLTGAAIAAAADSRTGELNAAVGAADRNASDLGAELSPAYGQPVGNGVAERLRAETASLVAVGAGGDRAQAAADLIRIRGEFDGLLSTANQLLPPGLVGQELRASGQPLLTAADAFTVRDFGTAFTRLRESARKSQKVADSVALSLVDRYPGRYLVQPTPTPVP